VFSTDTSTSGVAGQTLYDPSKSTTSKLVPNCTWDILYGDFSTSSGIVYRDTLTLGNITIDNMTIESARTVSTQFTKQKGMSGLVGLSFNALIQTIPAQPSLLDFFPQFLSESLFTVDLKHNSSEGSYNFGYIDHTLHSSDIEWINVDNSDGFWGVLMTGFAVENNPYRYEFASPQSVILDTGSTLFYAPDQAVTKYFESVPGANFSNEEYGYILPCNTTPPNFIWELGDANGTTITGEIPGEYFVYAVLDDGLVPPGYCYAGLQSLGGFTPLAGIFGDIYLKSGFQVFDVGNTKFGSAPKPLGPDRQSSGEDTKTHYSRQEKITLGRAAARTM
jgi:hypothetical protein